MRYLLLAASLFLAPSVAAAQTCAVPPAPAPAAAPKVRSVPLRQAALAVPGQALARIAPRTSVRPLASADIAKAPALARIASNGAQLSDLGMEHGLRGIFARKGNVFQVFYLAPDGRALVGGVMWDASGHNITRDQVTPIPGTIPTVRIGSDAAEAQTVPLTAPTTGLSPLKALAETTYGTIGSASAPRLWMLIDPMCAFSMGAMQALRPYVAAGRVQLAVIPLSVLDYEDQGRSTPTAEVMVSKPADRMVAAWTGQQLTGTPSPAAASLLSRNMAAAAAIRLRGTPTFIWRKADGSEGRADGVPADIGAMIAAVGR